MLHEPRYLELRSGAFRSINSRVLSARQVSRHVGMDVTRIHFKLSKAGGYVVDRLEHCRLVAAWCANEALISSLIYWRIT